MKLIINKDKCPENHKCPSIKICPKGAITQKDIYALPEINEELCILCGKCMKFCPKGAFEKIPSISGFQPSTENKIEL